MTYKNFKKSFAKSLMMLWNTFPILIGVILLVSLFNVLVLDSNYFNLFGVSESLNVLIADILGSVLAGNPVTSYIIAGEFLQQGISLLVVTVFIVSWVTVGVVQFPAESILLGKKFALIRNIVAFVFAIFVGIITVVGVNLL